MSPSHWLSRSFRGLERRERTFVVGGAAIAVGALVATYGVLPLVDRWTERERVIQARAENLARLEGLVGREAELGEAMEVLRERHTAQAQRLFQGATPALAASELQALLARYADQSRVGVGRIDLAGEPDLVAGEIVRIPVLLNVTADVYGLVDFLAYIQGGEKLIIIDDLTVRAGSPRRDGTALLTVNLRLSGLHAQTTEDES